MADVDRANRPLSPHMQIYRPQWTWVPSIVHRITGVGLLIGGMMLVWWLTAAAAGPGAFATADGIITSWYGHIVLLGLTWALAFHLLNGIRHLLWDIGRGFEVATAERAAQGVVIGSVVLTVLLWIVA